MKRRLLTAAMAAGLALGAGATSAGAETIRLSIGAGHPADAAAWVTATRDFFQAEITKRVAERTDYEINWTIGYGGSVARIGETLTAVQDGLLDVAMIAVPFMPRQLLAHNFPYFVPFGTGDIPLSIRAAVTAIEQNPGLAEIYDQRYNQKFLAVGAVGNYGMNTSFDWTEVEQLRNQRVAAAGPNMLWLEAVNAVPVQSNLVEAYTSIQTGVYSGWVMFPDGVVGFRLHEVSPYYVITDFGATPVGNITINNRAWNRLPPEVQEIFLEVAAEHPEASGRMTHEREMRSLETLRQEATVRELSWEEKVRWANALPHIPRERTEEIRSAGQPENVVRDFIRALKAEGAKLPRDWEEGL